MGYADQGTDMTVCIPTARVVEAVEPRNSHDGGAGVVDWE